VTVLSQCLAVTHAAADLALNGIRAMACMGNAAGLAGAAYVFRGSIFGGADHIGPKYVLILHSQISLGFNCSLDRSLVLSLIIYLVVSTQVSC
jgi:hypothetical protein